MPAFGKKVFAAAIFLVLLAIVLWPWRHMPVHWIEAHLTDRRPLNQARSWFYHLSNLDIDKITASKADLVVIDYARGGGEIALSKDEVARARRKPDGTPRLAVAYFSIGEAESYRFYWRSEWASAGMPAWHVAENCAWPRNHMVRFWHDGWKDIIYRADNSYLYKIVDAGFDGVYLDRVDVFWELMKERPGAREDMITFVRELAATARRLKPGFLVIAQNAEDLLVESRYRDAIDGLGKEDLLFGMSGTGVRNSDKEISQALGNISHLQWDWKPVFAVEYLTTQDQIDKTRAELTGYGFVPTFAHRSLDGSEPLAERPPSTMLYGTAEWIKDNCKDKPHW